MSSKGASQPGSWYRGFWLWMSSAAVMWVAWLALWSVELAFVDHSNEEFWGLVVWVVYVFGTVAGLFIALVIWLTLGRLIDAKARRPWPWYLLIGLVAGGWLAVGLRDAEPYAQIVGTIICLGGFVVGPLVARRAFVSRPWRVGLAVAMALGVVSLIGALL